MITVLAGALGGSLLSVISLLISRLISESQGLFVLALLLIVSAAAYVAFPIFAHEILSPWTVVALLQLLLIAVIALLGFGFSARWLIVGWALHPCWDLLIQHLGPASVFVPQEHPIACVSFDLVVALYVTIAYELFRSRLQRGGLVSFR